MPQTKPTSILVVLHGVNARGSSMRSMGFEPPALANGTLVLYPDATGGSWNDGRPGLEPSSQEAIANDVAFLRVLIGHVAARAGVDEKRAGMVGFSNGAMMASRFACDTGDSVRGIALVGGSGGQNITSDGCPNPRATAVVAVQGTNDPVVPYGGGQVADNGGRKRGRVVSAAEFFAFWSGNCHCTGGPQETTIRGALTVTKVEAQNCESGRSVVHYKVNGGSHEWFRFKGFDSTTVIWDFLAANALA